MPSDELRELRELFGVSAGAVLMREERRVGE